MANVEAVEKFKKLVNLALSTDEDDESTEEARTAAVKALAMLSDDGGELVVLPKAEVEALQQRIEGANAALAKVKDAKKEGMMLGGLAGFMLAKNGIGR